MVSHLLYSRHHRHTAGFVASATSARRGGPPLDDLTEDALSFRVLCERVGIANDGGSDEGNGSQNFVAPTLRKSRRVGHPLIQLLQSKNPHPLANCARTWGTLRSGETGDKADKNPPRRDLRGRGRPRHTVPARHTGQELTSSEKACMLPTSYAV
jgi:hypothetical protein